MTNLMTLQQVSELLDIPTSTLRYWDKQGLIGLSRATNQYRQISLHDLVNIIDVMQFRDMDIPIEQVKQTPMMNEEALLALLTENKTKLTQRIKAINHTIEKIALKQQALNRVMALKKQPLVLEYKQIKDIYRVDWQCAADIHQYLSPFQSADIYYPDNLEQEMSGMLCPSQSKNLIRQADSQPRLYLTGVMFRNHLTNEHNLADLLSVATDMGYTVELIISQFLAFAYDNEQGLRDYFEVWLAVKNNPVSQEN